MRIEAGLLSLLLLLSTAQAPAQEADGESPPKDASGEHDESLADKEALEKSGSEKAEAKPATSAQPVQQQDGNTSAAATTQAPVLEKTKQPRAKPDPEPAMDMNAVIALLQQQQEELVKQREILQSQSERLEEQSKQLVAQDRRLQSQTAEIATLTAELDVMQAPDPLEGGEGLSHDPEMKTEPVVAQHKGQKVEETLASATGEARARETGDAVAKAQTDDPTRALLEEFKGAWRLPGTSAALGIGGFVKTSVVYNWDPLEITDRFIVGSIPVDEAVTENVEAESNINASQSRLNFDLREPTEYGLLRAFIEGDFAEDNDTFRLRHAFGQWNQVLAGKTWSAFVDTSASPEEVDFEGLNGRINVRQAQVRMMPSLGEKYEFQFSMEDPNPQVQNGNGVTRTPDFIASGRFTLRQGLHTKAALLGRQIRAQRDLTAGGGVEKEWGWGLSLSGRYNTPQLDERDSLLFQINYGSGIGRYVNDLSSVGNFDGIFNPENGELELFDITAGYLSWQHWWKWWGAQQFRSNFTLGAVFVDNPGFVEGDAYERTIRFSTNVFWSPTPRIDIGGEYLWGMRENEDGEDGDAKQFQLGVRYRF